MKLFSILITTKNRIEDLKFTLNKISHLIDGKDIECIICDDGSTDNTYAYIKNNYPSIGLINNKNSRGLIYSRNRLLNLTTAKYAISLDDDAHFLSENITDKIESHFLLNPKCAVIAFRIFWSKKTPKNTDTNDKNKRVKGFVGCGHVWNMKAWKTIPNYPAWFVFYGEEEFASFQLFKKEWEVHYVPEILVQHRVEMKNRKINNDYLTRQRRSFRSGLYLYILFYPRALILRRFLYVISQQIKNKTFKGDVNATKAIVLAIFDVLINLPKLIRNRLPLSLKEFNNYKQINDTEIYWKPK